jgi:pSer/pThr/pTyr-binding forkhead associated (FHA) protein
VIKCPFCQATHVANTLFCNECGNYLRRDEGRKTDPLDTSKMAEGEASGSDEVDVAVPTTPDASPKAIQLRIGAKKRELEVSLAKTIHLGRVDPTSNVFPEIYFDNDVDAAKSVSRRHARIMKEGATVVIEDLASINGTYVNGKRLDPYIPEPIQDGDTVYLGKVAVELKLLYR